MRTAYCINWTEIEPGWGSRPDGHTLHTTKEIAISFRDKTLEDQAKNLHVGSDYVRAGEPFIVEITEDEEKALKDEKRKGTMWGHFTQNRRA